MMIKRPTILFLFASLLIITACDDNGNEPEPPQLASVYVINEGNFSQSNGSVTSYDPETKTATAAAFEQANGRPFAGYIQSSAIVNDQLYIVSNASNKVEVTDLASLNGITTIEYTDTPAAIAPAGDGQVYVSNLYSNSVSVIDTESMQVTDQTIPVGTQPRDMVYEDGYVYVSNAGGIQTAMVDNTISVIDTETNTVVNTIEVGDKPGKMVVDASGNIWLICSGLTAYNADYERVPEEDTPGGLFVIDTESQSIIQSQTLEERPADIVLNRGESRAYLLNDNIEVVNMNTFELTETDFINRSFNTIGYSVSEELIYAGQSNGLAQPGKAIQYNLQGTAVDSFETGISPIEFRFVTD